MRRHTLICCGLAAGAAGLIYAAAEGGQSSALPIQPPAGHEGHRHGGAIWPTDPIGAQLTALNRPLVRSLFGPFLLPELQSELGLTPDQASQLKQQKAELLLKGEDFSNKVEAKERELDALFAPDTSKGQQVKALLEQIAELRAQEHYAVYTAARKMKALLTDEQRSRLEALKPEEFRHAAMSRLTLEDFTKAMELLRF